MKKIPMKEIKEVQVKIKVSNLSLEAETWTIDEDEIQSIENAIDWIKENLESREEIDGFHITEKNFVCVGFNDEDQCDIIKTEDTERCIYLQKV